jgi:2,3-bisphosphoglycerate-independent phosphoglycerate mutase
MSLTKTKILCILDGFGLNVDSANNCISRAKMPTLRKLMSNYNWTTLNADGDKVGQETGLVGNSEVGHMNLGGLKVVPQLSYQITESSNQCFNFNKVTFPDQNFDPNTFLRTRFENNPKVIHLATLFSTGCIHSDLRHLVGAIQVAGKSGATKIVLHLFSDGRDSDKKSLSETWKNFTEMYFDKLSHYESIIELGSLGGRFFAMDRDSNWDRVAVAITPWLSKAVSTSNKNFGEFIKQTYGDEILDKTNQLMTKNTDRIKEMLNYGKSEEMIQTLSKYQGIKFSQIQSFVSEYSQLNYQNEIFDEGITPACLSFIMPKETIWLLNFRSDRVKQVTKMLVGIDSFFGIDLNIMSMNSYGLSLEKEFDQTLDTTKNDNYGYFPVFTTKPVIGTLAEKISSMSKTQLHIAETEKYAHVTFFFDGGLEKKSVGEDWLVIPSNKVENHAEKPEMKAKEITDYILDNGVGKYDYIIVNYANPDMVGHTGDIPACIESMNFLDLQLSRLVETCEKNDHSMIIVADHGNMEFVGSYTENGQAFTDTEHNASPVPCILVKNNFDLDEIFENLDKENIVYDKESIKKSLRVDFRRDYSQTWLQQGEIKQIENNQLPLWYAGVWLIGL